MTSARPIVLASSSPRRRELLEQLDIPFSVIVSGCDESPVRGESPGQMVERLARAKAQAVAERHPDAYVIGADTDVFIDGKVLGKPASDEDACETLSMIQGRGHEVWGGIAVVCRDLAVEVSSSHCTKVMLTPMSTEAIRWYVATGEPRDKAGSYAIQGLGGRFVDRIEGSYSNVVGLDVAALSRMLLSLHIIPF